MPVAGLATLTAIGVPPICATAGSGFMLLALSVSNLCATAVAAGLGSSGSAAAAGRGIAVAAGFAVASDGLASAIATRSSRRSSSQPDLSSPQPARKRRCRRGAAARASTSDDYSSDEDLPQRQSTRAAIGATPAKRSRHDECDAVSPAGDNQYPPVDIYNVAIGDVIYVDRVHQAKGPKSNWDGGKCVVKSAVIKPDRNDHYIQVKTFEIGARLEKVCAWNPRVEPGSSNSQSSPDSAAVRPAASQTGVKRSSASASSAGSAKRAHTNGRFSDSDDSSDNDSSDFGDDEVESRDAKLHWPEVQRLDLPLTVIPGQPDVKVVVVVRYNQDSFDDCNSPERHNKDMLAAIMGVLQPKLTDTMTLQRSTNKHCAVYASLAWAWSGNSGFRSVMRKLGGEFGRQAKSKGRDSEWSDQTRKAWVKFCREAVANAATQDTYAIDIVFTCATVTGGAQAPSQHNRSKQTAKKQSARKHRQLQDEVMMLQAIFSLGEYTSFAAYERARRVFFEKYGDQKRSSKKRGSAGISLSVPPTLAAIRIARTERLKRLRGCCGRCEGCWQRRDHCDHAEIHT